MWISHMKGVPNLTHKMFNWVILQLSCPLKVKQCAYIILIQTVENI